MLPRATPPISLCFRISEGNFVYETFPVSGLPFAVIPGVHDSGGGHSGEASGVLDFAEEAAGDVVDETADGDGLRNPGMRAEFLQLMADVFFHVLKSVEKGGRSGGGPGGFLDAGAQIVLARLHQSAVGM